jgi:hypothetical protein
VGRRRSKSALPVVVFELNAFSRVSFGVTSAARRPRIRARKASEAVVLIRASSRRVNGEALRELPWNRLVLVPRIGSAAASVFAGLTAHTRRQLDRLRASKHLGSGRIQRMVFREAGGAQKQSDSPLLRKGPHRLAHLGINPLQGGAGGRPVNGKLDHQFYFGSNRPLSGPPLRCWRATSTG